MNVREIRSKTILSVSQVYSYAINPYVGCQHACHYCYARFMKRFSGHKEPWGNFVDVKINAADLLRIEINKKKPAGVWMSGVCDPYQPLEAHYKLSRKCLEILTDNNWPVVIQTRSPLVLRDIDILKRAKDCEVGLTITTADDEIRKLFEPNAPPIKERLTTLDELHRSGIKTYAMIAPILPGAEVLVNDLQGKVDYIIVDRMNYNYADWIYRKNRWEDKLSDDFFQRTGRELVDVCQKLGIACNLVF
jgi:DNA repair photolyase